MPCAPVDGMDPVKVAEAIDKCAKHARSGKGPSLLDVKTYRYRGHSMSDAQQYRTKEEVEEYRKIDPITQVEKIILSKKYGPKSDIWNLYIEYQINIESLTISSVFLLISSLF